MKNKSKLIVMALAVAMCVGIVGISAYFTDAETVTNEFVIGEVSLSLQEPNWEEPTQMLPNDEIDKDPQILNDGKNDEYVFLTVAVPYKNLVTANEDGTKNAAADVELFTYEIDAENWVQVGNAEKDTENGVVLYTYAYAKNDAMTALAKDQTTTPLFESVKFANIVEDQNMENTQVDIVIKAYGIQTTNINGGKTAPADVWTVVTNQAPTVTPAA